MYFGSYRRHSAGSALGSVIILCIVVPLELCTDHGYNGHHSRYDRYERHDRQGPERTAAADVQPHMAGAFYPEDHPELKSSRPPDGHPLTYVPYVSAGLGGLAVFLLVGSGAFLVLGMGSDDDAIDLDAPG